jgi:hypothetical protein
MFCKPTHDHQNSKPTFESNQRRSGSPTRKLRVSSRVETHQTLLSPKQKYLSPWLLKRGTCIGKARVRLPMVLRAPFALNQWPSGISRRAKPKRAFQKVINNMSYQMQY